MMMSDYPYLSLNRVSLDPELARLLPRRLAYYYLALPLARDDEEITVVMAHPGNQTAVTVLQAVLGGRVVPVRGSVSEIRAMLNQLWAEEADATARSILCWGASENRAELAAAVAELIAPAFAAQTIRLDSSQSTMRTVITVAHQGQHCLTVIDAPEGKAMSRLMRHSATPVLLVRGAQSAFERILLVLRGHSPDESVLDWVIPLAQARQAEVTLLTVAPVAARGPRHGAGAPYGLATLLSSESGPGEHIATCARRLTEAGIRGRLKLRQGVTEQQIAVEMAQGDYDLITIAAEAHGDFVQHVLDEIKSQAPLNEQPVLVVKPDLSLNDDRWED
jgi:nucleotide-binding universal stress UspA family protein